MSTVSHVGGPAAVTVERADVDRCAGAIAEATESIFGGLAAMAAAMAGAWDGARRFSTADFVELRPHIFEQLDRHAAYDSAGFVMTQRALADLPRHLEWWHRTRTGAYEELVLPVEPGSPDCYDYYSMDWFVAAVDEGRRFASGPKIDLPCADVYIITFTHPVVAHGALLGVSAADVALSRFESRVRPPLQRVAAPAVLVNRERRVIASNDPAWTTGERLREVPAAGTSAWPTVVPVTADLGWLLAVAAAPAS